MAATIDDIIAICATTESSTIIDTLSSHENPDGLLELGKQIDFERGPMNEDILSQLIQLYDSGNSQTSQQVNAPLTYPLQIWAELLHQYHSLNRLTSSLEIIYPIGKKKILVVMQTMLQVIFLFIMTSLVRALLKEKCTTSMLALATD